MTFGKRLFQMRKDRGLSLRDLAEKAGMDHTLLSKIENDLRPDPEADLLFALLDALGTVKPVTDEEMNELLSAAKGRLTPERLERMRGSPSLRRFMRRKPRSGSQQRERERNAAEGRKPTGSAT